MGTNAVTNVLISEIDERFWQYVICSAGDDQSVAAQEITIGLQDMDEVSYLFIIEYEPNCYSLFLIEQTSFLHFVSNR